MINVEISLSNKLTNKLISQGGKIFCSLLFSRFIIVEQRQVFNLRAAENGRSSTALFVAFTVADCNVCLVLSTST